MAPWVFMFLIPAITMRSFAEEKRTGTLELLLTKPISDTQIVLAKFFAGLILVVVALIPTLIAFASVHFLGNPVGNVDSGGTWGSYVGLLFLGVSYVAIGTFASSITSNQIVSFLVAAFLCFLAYSGFEQIGTFNLFGSFDDMLIRVGMSYHYESMSRGLIDTRDLVYFICLISIFIILTRTVLQSRKW
jgi:ABC-2 type transport system permease protein